MALRHLLSRWHVDNWETAELEFACLLAGAKIRIAQPRVVEVASAVPSSQSELASPSVNIEVNQLEWLL